MLAHLPLNFLPFFFFVRDEIENFVADYNSTPCGVVVVVVVGVQIKKWITF